MHNGIEMLFQAGNHGKHKILTQESIRKDKQKEASEANSARLNWQCSSSLLETNKIALKLCISDNRWHLNLQLTLSLEKNQFDFYHHIE